MAQHSISLDAIWALLNRLAKWLLLGAIIWLCWGIARIIWLLLAPPQAPNLPLSDIQTQTAPTFNTSAVLAIFDEDRPKPQAPKRPPPDVSLTGVMLAVPEHLSSAMLEVNGTISSYRIGAPIGDTGYQVSAVTWDHVIISDISDISDLSADSGQDITLNMPERMALDQKLNFKDGNAGANNRSASLPQPSDAHHAQPDYDADEDRASVISPTGSHLDANDSNNKGNNSAEAQIDKAVTELKQNPASYLSRMGVMATGEGYQVTDAMPSDLKNRLGLEAGDRVMSVNGRSVGSNPAGDADLLNQVKQSGEAQIEVQRGEQTITIRQRF